MNCIPKSATRCGHRVSLFARVGLLAALCAVTGAAYASQVFSDYESYMFLTKGTTTSCKEDRFDALIALAKSIVHYNKYLVPGEGLKTFPQGGPSAETPSHLRKVESFTGKATEWLRLYVADKEAAARGKAGDLVYGDKLVGAWRFVFNKARVCSHDKPCDADEVAGIREFVQVFYGSVLEAIQKIDAERYNWLKLQKQEDGSFDLPDSLPNLLVAK